MVLVLIIVGSVVIYSFFSITNNPIDKIAKAYFYNNTNLKSQHGTFFSIGGNIIKKSHKEAGEMSLPYTVETNNVEVLQACSLDVKEMTENAYTD